MTHGRSPTPAALLLMMAEAADHRVCSQVSCQEEEKRVLLHITG